MMARELFSPRMLEFNFLPSVTLHPSRREAFGAPAAAVPAACPAAVWHRHWSRLILRRLDLFERPVLDARRPELALALLPPDRLERLGRHLGAALCGRRLRQVIDGAEVRRLIVLLGADGLDFARRQDVDPAFEAFDETDAGERSDPADRVDALGRTAVRMVLRDAGPEIGLRAELKMADEPLRPLAVGSQGLLARALDILKQIEPAWHSSFPAPR